MRKYTYAYLRVCVSNPTHTRPVLPGRVCVPAEQCTECKSLAKGTILRE